MAALRWLAAVPVAVSMLTAAPSARADDSELVIDVQGFDNWPAAVAALEADVTAQGRVVLASVHPRDGGPIACSQYQLTLDATAARAFEVGTCHADTSMTEVRLANRDALFDHSDIVPRPLTAGITAVHLATGGASGGAGQSGGSELRCTVSVQPYLTDLEHGTRVYLTPGRFQLRGVESQISVDPDAHGWTLRAAPGQTGATVTTSYEVYDTQRSEVVLRDQTATLSCEEGSASPPPAPPFVPPPVPQATLPNIALTVLKPPVVDRPVRVALIADVQLLNGGYLPLGNVPFHVGGQTWTGNQVGIDGALFLTGGVIGLTFEAYHLFLSAQPRWFASQNIAMIGADFAAGSTFVAGPVHFRMGMQASVWQAWLYAAGTNGVTDGQAGLGLLGQVVYRSRRAPSGGARAHFIETGLTASVPLFGQGALMLGWTASWGTGV